MKLISAVLVVLMVACVANAQSAVFYPTKDNSSDRYEVNMNQGAVTAFRGAKAPWREDLSYYDFDTAAIQAFLDANGLTAATAKVEFFLRPATFAGETPDGVTGIQVRTLISGTDWAEGATDEPWASLTWGVGEPGATYTHAQAYYYLDGNDDPQLDTAACIPWTASAAAGGRAYENLRDMLLNGPAWTGAEGVVNSAYWTPANADLVYTGVVLDAAVVTDLLTNPDNRGLMLYDVNGVSWPNWEVYFREAGEGYAPYLLITPEPATMTLLALGGLALIRRRRA